MKLFTNKCLCGKYLSIKDNGNGGEFWCDRCDEFNRDLTKEEYEKYLSIQKKGLDKMLKTINEMFEAPIAQR